MDGPDPDVGGAAAAAEDDDDSDEPVEEPVVEDDVSVAIFRRCSLTMGGAVWGVGCECSSMVRDEDRKAAEFGAETADPAADADDNPPIPMVRLDFPPDDPVPPPPDAEPEPDEMTPELEEELVAVTVPAAAATEEGLPRLSRWRE